MKKIKFDPKKAQEFLLSHVEKLIFGLVVLGFFYFAYQTLMNRQGFSQTPTHLVRASTDAWEKVKRPPEKLPVEMKDYENLIQKTMGKIDPKAYSDPKWELCPPVFDPPPKRGEPRLLTVQDLRGTAGCGKVYAAPPQKAPTTSPDEMLLTEGPMPTAPTAGLGRESTEGERWVVLTGLVPYKKQIEAYIEAFREASRQSTLAAGTQPGALPGQIPAAAPGMLEGPVPGGMAPVGTAAGASADMPIYVHYNIQRVEVSGPSDAIEEAQWEAGNIHIGNAKKEAFQRWGAQAGPVSSLQQTDYGIHPLFWDQALDFPLPRFADGRALDDSFAHPPEIPLLKKRTYTIGPDGRPLPPTTTSTETPEAAPTEKPEKPEPPKPEEKDIPDIPGAIPGIGPAGRGELAPGMVPGGIQPGMVEGMGPMGPVPGTTPGSFSGIMRWPEFKLFRFIDRTVEPGKRYRYRVRLLLLNPNYKQNPRLLERPELGKDPYIFTPWSEPSNVVEVPRDDRLLVLGVKQSSTEPAAKVALLHWIHNEGELATKEDEKVLRGQVLNVPNQKWPEEDTRKPSPTSPQPVAKQAPGEGALLEDFQALMSAGSSKSKKTSKEKEKPPTSPELMMGPGYGLQPKEPTPIDYLTDCLVVDLRGGYRIDMKGQGRAPHTDPNYNAPGEILLLHPEGYLYVQSELEDAPQYEEILQMRRPKYDERLSPGWMGPIPGMLEGGPPPAGVPGELAPGEKARPKPSKTTSPKREAAPKGAVYPPRG